MARKSYQDHFEAGVAVEPLACDGCGKLTPAFGIYEGQEGEPDGWICGVCIQDVARQVRAAEEAANALPSSSWDSEAGKFLKAERIRLLREYAWTVDATSPFSDEGKALWMTWVTSLNRMTIESTPDTWTWPALPEQLYA